MSGADAADAPEVEIHSIGALGAGVGELPSGKVVFVHRTAPGDRVRVRITKEKASWARGRIEEVLRGGPGRRQAPCPHYDRCGGCTLEHLRYVDQLRAKGRIVADALERIGGREVEPPAVEPSPFEFRYRSRITCTLRRLKGDRVVAGFHELERPGRIVDIGGECLLPTEALARAWVGLRAEWGEGAGRLPAGRTLRLTLRTVERGFLLLVEGGEGAGEPEALLDGVPRLRSLWHRPEGAEGPPVLLAGDGEPEEVWDGERFPVGPTAFLQVNREAAESLHSAVLREVGAPRGLRVIDAYCGVGLVGRRLAQHGAEVVGIEADPGAVRAAGTRAPDGFRVVEGLVEERLEELLPADVVVLNPPRGGLHEEIPPVLRSHRPPRLVYVSCDPATLARDLDRLGDAYEIGTLRAFDLFPQTAHVETLVGLSSAGTP